MGGVSLPELPKAQIDAFHGSLTGIHWTMSWKPEVKQKVIK